MDLDFVMHFIEGADWNAILILLECTEVVSESAGGAIRIVEDEAPTRPHNWDRYTEYVSALSSARGVGSEGQPAPLTYTDWNAADTARAIAD